MTWWYVTCGGTYWYSGPFTSSARGELEITQKVPSDLEDEFIIEFNEGEINLKCRAIWIDDVKYLGEESEQNGLP
jgi:hypothetical protein